MKDERVLSTLVRLLSKGRVALPIEFRRRLKIDAGTILNLTLKGGRIEIVPLRPVPRSETFREYSEDDIRRLLKEDRLDSATAAKVRRLLGRTKPA